MAKRIIVVKDDNKIEIWDNQLEYFKSKGYSEENSKPIIKQQTSKFKIKEDK